MSLTAVAEYQIVKVLGEGGQGKCYEGHHLRSGEAVAIKVIEWDAHVSSAENQRGRIQREIAYLKGKRLPGVVKLLDSGEIPVSRDFPRGAAYIVYELIGDGSTLRDRLLGLTPVGVCDVIEACYRLGETLRSLARRGVFHRDIKPQNIAFRSGNNWRPVLIDFGIARAEDATTITSTGKMWGSPYYSPPEWLSPPASGKHRESNPGAWDCYSFARTTGVALAVALGRRLDKAEWLSNRELLSILRRHFPSTTKALKEALQENPDARPNLRNICLGLGDLDIDIWIADDLATRAVLNHQARIHSAVEERLGCSLRSRVRRDKYGFVDLVLTPRRPPRAPYLTLGAATFVGQPCLTLRGSALTGRSASRRKVADQFAAWCRRNRRQVAVLDVGLKWTDGVEKTISRTLNAARRSPSKELVVAWRVYTVEQARAYERLSRGDVAPIEALVELWRLVMQ